MFKINGTPIERTEFPDGTSQIWKLPEELFHAKEIKIEWIFSGECELMDLMSICKLFQDKLTHLYMPYLPYARQDKDVSNSSTFNLVVFAELLNALDLTTVTALDPHSQKAEDFIVNFRAISPGDFQKKAIAAIKPDVLIFPDSGAMKRYILDIADFWTGPVMQLAKDRNPLTGEVFFRGSPPSFAETDTRVLFIDDICDGGATFIEAVKYLRAPTREFHLFVTHGIFSKGRRHLIENGVTPHCAKDYQ